jgi:hypothetical protein
LDEKIIIIWERIILRRIFGPKKEDGIWKIRTNKELIELYNNPDIVARYCGVFLQILRLL